MYKKIGWSNVALNGEMCKILIIEVLGLDLVNIWNVQSFKKELGSPPVDASNRATTSFTVSNAQHMLLNWAAERSRQPNPIITNSMRRHWPTVLLSEVASTRAGTLPSLSRVAMAPKARSRTFSSGIAARGRGSGRLTSHTISLLPLRLRSNSSSTPPRELRTGAPDSPPAALPVEGLRSSVSALTRRSSCHLHWYVIFEAFLL
jgi:hypothetical protein